MSSEIYANGRELACAAGGGKTICAMPDVCFTPPENPATPPGVPVPYPNSAFDSDTTDGSKTVEISGKEIMLKNQSCFKKSTGDEAGCATKKGAITGSTAGKVYFTSWSMDVSAEGENVVRHLDMTTDNHACPEGNESVPWPFIKKEKFENPAVCDGMITNEKNASKDYAPHANPGGPYCKDAGLDGPFSSDAQVIETRMKSAQANDCAKARRCLLVKYSGRPQDGVNGCCPSQSADHVMPKSSFFVDSVRKKLKFDSAKTYSAGAAPCMCLEGGSNSGSHGLRHAYHKAFSPVPNGAANSFSAEAKFCAASAEAVAPQCKAECIEAQVTAGHEEMGCDVKGMIKHSSTGENPEEHPGLMDRIKEALWPAVEAAIESTPAPTI